MAAEALCKFKICLNFSSAALEFQHLFVASFSAPQGCSPSAALWVGNKKQASIVKRLTALLCTLKGRVFRA
ncbi:MAG: hypothetical protein DYG88_05270 [Chloroflexi bacterium CFX4]|nr:hypothetical protein [Chloroflexi bacterium CFX4]